VTDRRELEFEIDAPREAVWRALAEPDGLLGWFASEARVTPEVGGEYYAAHGEHGQSSTIEEIVPGERLLTRSGETTTEFVLEGREGTTLLRVVQSGFGEEDYGSLERGWGDFIETLRHYLGRHRNEPAAGAYVYAQSARSVKETRAALPKSLPDGAEVFDEQPRSLGARIPVLGDGMYRASIEGRDGEAWVWVHLVGYGDGRNRLDEVRADVERALDLALRAGRQRAGRHGAAPSEHAVLTEPNSSPR
jgi:uncharacterized protein YndB with AHSA1/START domain